MCGIVGLYLKNKKLHPHLGELFQPMMVEMSDRGPDSAGFAIFRRPTARGKTKFSLATLSEEIDWNTFIETLKTSFNQNFKLSRKKTFAILIASIEPTVFHSWLLKNWPSISLIGSGKCIEIFKKIGLPVDVCEEFKLKKIDGSHAIGHTRMATESAVTLQGAHPFSSGLDLCLVHNGSLSNHNFLRRKLQKDGIAFQTDNDTEVAAQYMSSKLRQGLSLQKTLEEACSEIDGFFTFCVGTENGFAVVRDAFSCKHAVLAETNDWVAMGTEYRALAHLPGAESARIWEPQPLKVYNWMG